MPLADTDLQFRLSIARAARSAHVATVAGELDLHNAPELEDGLRRLAQRPGTKLVVDLCDVPFIDSTALGVLVGLAKSVRAGGGDFVLATGDPRLHRLLEITGLLRLLPIESSLARAVER